MEIILLILAVLILGKSKNLENRDGFNVIAGSVFGISYFVIWPYFSYYLQLLHKNEIFIQVIFIALIFLSLLLIKLLLQIKNHLIPQVLLIILFLIMLGGTSVYEIEVKDKLAEFTNYFSPQLVITNKNRNILTKVISGPEISYSVNIPVQWKEHKHKITSLAFFTPDRKNTAIIEFRPRCYDVRKKNMSSIIDGMTKNIKVGEETDYQCYQWLDNNGYACKITTSHKSGDTKRIRWLGVNKNTKRIFELDFITKNSTKRDKQLIDSIFESVRFNSLPEYMHSCVYSIDWF